MMIDCPFCGRRSVQEFRFRGEASVQRPSSDAFGDHSEQDFVDYVYFRDNLAGAQEEHCFHAYGCRRWLTITRDTRTHDILRIQASAEARAQARAELAR